MSAQRLSLRRILALVSGALLTGCASQVDPMVLMQRDISNLSSNVQSLNEKVSRQAADINAMKAALSRAQADAATARQFTDRLETVRSGDGLIIKVKE